MNEKRALFFPLASFEFIGKQSAIQLIKENIHFFVSFLFVMNFPRFYANKPRVNVPEKNYLE